MNEDMIIDQSPLAESVSENIKYTFLDFFLVKPLDPIRVKKEITKPVSTGTPVEDANGVKAEDFNSVETEVVEVNSDYRRGIVLKRPLFFDDPNRDPEKDGRLPDIKIGDVIIFRDAAGLQFDLLKDSRLLRLYDILGTEK